MKNPLKTTILIPSGGTGQMLSLPINEFVRTELGRSRHPGRVQGGGTGGRLYRLAPGAADPSLKGVSAGNIAYVTSDPFYAILRFYDSKQISPNGVNWSHYRNPEVDGLCDKVKASLDPAEQDKLLLPDPRDRGERCRAGLGGSRHERPCAVEQGEAVCPGPTLVQDLTTLA